MKDAFPLLLSQRAVYIQCQTSGESTQYNLPFCYSYGQTVKPEHLVQSLRAAFAIHTGFRMRLGLDEHGQVYQYPDTEELKIDTVQLTESEFEIWKSQWMRPFDLLHEPLVRVALVLMNKQVFLFWDAHHIVCDGTSHMAFNATLGEILRGKAPMIEAIDLKQAVTMERQRTQPQRVEEDLAWYGTVLSGCETTALTRRPDKVDSRLETVVRVVASQRVDEACGGAQVPPSVFFMSVLSLSLAKWTQVDTVQLCVVNHGRWDKSLARTSGMFVRTLPIAVDVASEKTTADFLRSNRQLLRELWTHQSVPLGELLDRYGLSMEVSYSWQGFYGSSLGGAQSLEKLPLTQPLRPLSVQVFVEEGKYIVHTEYDTACFRASDMESFADAFETCLSGMTGSLARTFNTIDIVSETAEQELLTLGRGESLVCDAKETFLSVFARNVKYDPDKAAVVAENGTLSWQVLDESSSLLAEELVKNGARRGAFVCIMLPRVKEFMVATLGVFKSGAAYVPLDPEYPEERLLYMLQDSQAEILITTKALYEEKNADNRFKVTQVVFLDDHNEVAAVERGRRDRTSRGWDLAVPEPEDAAYMIYTSGSTGRPKGVVIRHKSLLSYLAGWQGKAYEIRRDDRICCAFSFSFDASVSNLYGSLYAGATLHIVSSWVRMDLSLLNRYIQEHGITAAKFPTQLGMELFEQYAPPLRFTIFGGETMKPIRKCQTQLINGYGPTEFTVNATFHVVDQAKDTAVIPIGRPVPNARAFIVSRVGRLVPRGAVGELCFAGRQIAREYWNRADLTAEKFVVNPWSDGGDDITMYRTGDLARWNEDGELECLGRIDHQVKLRGFRIELGEIECVLAKYPQVRSCVVVVRELGSTQHLCAYYVSDRDIDETDLRSFLAAGLTEYMVPTVYTRLVQMPLTPNGKIDRNSLPEPRLQTAVIVVPASSREQKLLDLTMEVFGGTSFGVTTNLMSIGLTSMTAIRLATQIQKRLDWPISTRDILRHSTIRELARLTEGELADHGPYQKQKQYRLASNQEGLYVQWRLRPKSTQYNHPECYRFAAVDPDRLRAVLERVIDAHPILKAGISLDAQGRPLWIRRDDEPCEIEVVRLQKDPGYAFFQSRIRPFDLETDLLYRVTICLSPRGTSLFVDVHHIAFDGVSADIFWEELSRCFAGQSIEQERFTAFDESLYEANQADQTYIDAACQYFTGLLEGVSSTEFPSFTSGDGISGIGRAERTLARGEVVRFCREHALTENSLFMTSVGFVLRRLCSEDVVQFVTVSSGRTHRELESTIGMFVKTLPIVLSRESGTLLEHAETLQRQLLETLDYDLYPYSRLVSEFGLSPQIAFIWQERFGRTVVLDGKPGERIDFDSSDPKFPFSVEIVPCGDWYQVTTEYDASLYSERDAKIFLDALCQFVGTAIQKESRDVDGDLINIVSSSERKDLLRLACGGDKVDATCSRSLQRSPMANKTFMEVFAKHVLLKPDEIAVVAGDGQLTYVQLDARSETLAEKLCEKGVLPGTFVCVMFERSISFIIGVLGIFKAGGAYIPLDVAYPNERLLYMLQDSEAQVLLTTRRLYEQKQFGNSFDESKVVFVDDPAHGNETDQAQPVVKHLNDKTSSGGRPCIKVSDPAYMIYTSGSTGHPKGVVVSIRSLVAYLSSWQGTRFEPKPGERFCCYPSFSFDASIDDLLGPLFFGATSYIVPERIRRDVEALTDWLNAEKITAGSFPAQMGTTLLAHSNLTMRYVRLGGEKFVLPGSCNVEVLNVYGPTEFTVCCAWHVVNRETDRHGIPIGRPVRGCSCYVLSSRGALLPRGVYGQLCLAGRQLANGYWRRPELTAERFVVNPLAEGEDDKLMYRTGDLVRWNDDGELEYLGRADNQIKLRGFRIEPGEIETVIGEFPGVTSVAVALKTVGASVVLCAYYKSTSEIQEERLRDFLARRLTEYMVPSVFIRLDAFPLTPGGKIDHKALPAPQAWASRVYVEPQTAEQSALVQVFSEILRVGQVGIDDGFFALGGDSIKAIRAVSRLRQLGFRTNVAVIMQFKTAREIARETCRIDSVETSDDRPVEGIVPLTYVQRYFGDLGMRNPDHFNQSILLECAGRIDEGALCQSLDALIAHHDMLRVRLIDGVQKIIPVHSAKLRTFSVCDLTKAVKWHGDMSRKAGQAQRSLSLSKGPLVASVLFRTPDKDYLLLVIHHFVVDGVSWRILTDDLQTAYSQSVSGNRITLPPKTASFKSWSQAVERYRDSESLAAELPYWTRVQESLASGDQKCRSKGVFRFLETSLEQQTTSDLLGPASVAYSTGPNDLLCSAVCQAFAKVFGKSQVSMQMEGHGREDIGTELSIDRTVGWFTSAWPVVFDIDVNNTRASIRGVKETLRRVPNHGVGYGILQYIGTAALKRDVAVDLSFNYLGQLDEGGADRFFRMNHDLPQGNAMADGNRFGPPLGLVCHVREGALAFRLAYDTNVHAKKDCETFLCTLIKELTETRNHCLGVSVPEPTASDLGELQWNDEEYNRVVETFARRNATIRRIYPLTPMQEGFLFHRLSEPDSSAYVLQKVYACDRALEPDDVAKAVESLGRCHDVLRTSIIYKGVDSARQAIVDGRPFEVSFRDLSGSTNQEGEIAAMMKADLRRNFDLQDDPLFRVAVIRTGPKSTRLLVTQHHIIVDGWCIGILTSDLERFLSEAVLQEKAKAKGTKVSRKETPSKVNAGTDSRCVSTCSYEAAVRKILAFDTARALEYWKKLLADCETASDIPCFAKNRNKRQSVSHEVEQSDCGSTREELNWQRGHLGIYALGVEMSEAIDELCRRLDITPNTIFEAALGLVLQTCNRSQDVVFGKVVSGRTLPLPGIEKTVGLFINTIPVRVQTQANQTGAALLTALQSQAAASTRYDRCALSEIMAGHDLGTDLIKTVFAFENYEVESDEKQWPIRLVPEAGGEETNYDVSFLAHKRSNEYEIVVMGSASRFDAETPRRLAKLFGLLVENLTKRSDEAVSVFDLVDGASRKELIAIASGEPPQEDRRELFLEAFARQVAIRPAKTAVVAKNGSLTYRELNDLSDRLARKLIDSGVTGGTFVCIMLERTTWFMVAALAVFKAGSAYVPLDSDYPSERLVHMLQDSGAGVLVTSREQYEQKRRQGLIDVPIVLFASEVDSVDGRFTQAKAGDLDQTGKANKANEVNKANGANGANKANQVNKANEAKEANGANGHTSWNLEQVADPVPCCTAESPAYMIYTSGSTGKPKGVVVSHGAIASYLSWNRRLFGLTESDRVCCHSSFSFDASIDSLFGPLMIGGEVHIVPESLRQDLRLLCDYLTEHKITGGTFSTQMGMELLNYGKASLRFIFLGGEKLKPVKPCDTMIVNGYGPTEFTVCSNYHVVNQAVDLEEIPIGRPVPGSWSYVLDSAGRLLPWGVPGELCISGRQLANGYWNRPELTKEKFVNNPFGEDADSRRYYRTGDLVRWNEEGNLEYLGRIDTQVKIRGFRIELGEIESAMAKYPSVQSVCVDVRTMGATPQLVAWFVASENVDVEKLRDWLSEKLTDYMLPSVLTQVERIPLTPNGKVDRKSLKVPEIKRQEIVLPRDAIESRMYDAAVQILGTREFGVTTNLFSAGMTSMTGIRFAAAIQNISDASDVKNGTPITYADIFKYQTIERLARLASGRVGELSIQYHLEDVSRFDYTQIESLLRNNSLAGMSTADNLLTGHYENILLTGSTGFLGVHVLAAFLERFPGKVYCLVRPSKDHKIARRLLQYLFFYFDRSYAEETENRLCVVEGDITDRDGLLALDLGVTHVINCAANVKHFSEGDDIHRVNFCGVENLIEYCKKFGAKLIHVSTVSIAGSTDADSPLATHGLGENELFVGQTLDNKYIHSKFLAERSILAAVGSNEIAAKIMRAGNLMPRARDGVFQMNAASNAFAKRLRAYKLLGVYPISRLAAPVELSPIDETARVLLTLGLVNDRFTLFHLYNNHSLSMGDVIGAMNRYGFGIRPVSDSEFSSRLADAARNEKMVENLSGIIAYQPDRVAAVTVPVATTSAFTATVLYCLAEDWTLLARDYLTNMIDQLNGLGFFDERF